eukprot:3941684-Rhodomonas_salina.4
MDSRVRSRSRTIERPTRRSKQHVREIEGRGHGMDDDEGGGDDIHHHNADHEDREQQSNRATEQQSKISNRKPQSEVKSEAGARRLT